MRIPQALATHQGSFFPQSPQPEDVDTNIDKMH